MDAIQCRLMEMEEENPSLNSHKRSLIQRTGDKKFFGKREGLGVSPEFSFASLYSNSHERMEDYLKVFEGFFSEDCVKRFFCSVIKDLRRPEVKDISESSGVIAYMGWKANMFLMMARELYAHALKEKGEGNNSLWPVHINYILDYNNRSEVRQERYEWGPLN
jgi:hypothetical protein